MTNHSIQSTPLTRRRWIAQGVAGSLGALSMPTWNKGTDAAPANVEPGWIDAHVHVWTPDTKQYPLGDGFTKLDMQPPSFTPEQLLAHARPCGVARVVLIQMSFYGHDNSYMLDTMARFPGVFSGVAVVDPAAADVRDQMLQLKSRGVRGFRLNPRSLEPAKYFSQPGVQRMWEIGAAEKLALGLLVNPNSLPVIDAMCQQHPDTPVVIDHFARIGVTGKILPAELESLCQLAKHRHLTVKISAFYALGKKQMPYDDLRPMIERLLAAFGPERLMWATDCPYQVNPGHTYESSLALVRDRLGLSAGDRDWLLRKTAETVFFA